MPSIVRILLPAVALLLYFGLLVVNPVRVARQEGNASASIVEARELARRADEAFKAGRFADAVAALEPLEQRTPDSPVVLGLLAQSYERLGRWKDAAERWELFIPVAPSPEEACPGLPRAYDALGLADKAFDAYERCYRIAPDDHDMAVRFGLALERRGDVARARALYEAVVASNPKNQDAVLGLTRTRRGVTK